MWSHGVSKVAWCLLQTRNDALWKFPTRHVDCFTGCMAGALMPLMFGPTTAVVPSATSSAESVAGVECVQVRRDSAAVYRPQSYLLAVQSPPMTCVQRPVRQSFVGRFLPVHTCQIFLPFSFRSTTDPVYGLPCVHFVTCVFILFCSNYVKTQFPFVRSPLVLVLSYGSIRAPRESSSNFAAQTRGKDTAHTTTTGPQKSIVVLRWRFPFAVKCALFGIFKAQARATQNNRCFRMHLNLSVPCPKCGDFDFSFKWKLKGFFADNDFIRKMFVRLLSYPKPIIYRIMYFFNSLTTLISTLTELAGTHFWVF